MATKERTRRQAEEADAREALQKGRGELEKLQWRRNEYAADLEELQAQREELALRRQAAIGTKATGGTPKDDPQVLAGNLAALDERIHHVQELQDAIDRQMQEYHAAHGPLAQTHARSAAALRREPVELAAEEIAGHFRAIEEIWRTRLGPESQKLEKMGDEFGASLCREWQHRLGTQHIGFNGWWDIRLPTLEIPS